MHSGYLHFSKSGFCDVIGTLNLVFKSSTPSTALEPLVEICVEGTTILDVSLGYATPGSINRKLLVHYEMERAWLYRFFRIQRLDFGEK